MGRIGEKLASLAEYFGSGPRGYYHSRPEISYDPDDFLAYYLDQTQRASYGGPFDDKGLPLYPTPSGYVRLPVHIIPFGLGHLELYRQTGSQQSLDRFRQTADWLVASQRENGDWLTPTPMPRFNLKHPFPSAMTQGLAISTLVRAARVFDSEQYTVAASRALVLFQQEVKRGGVTSYHDAGPFYEEYPCEPQRHVLNGFVFALWGLYDLVRVEDNHEARLLWKNGLGTLAAWLPDYDVGYWSLYQLPRKPSNPATIAYHDLHIRQLEIMHRLTGQPVFSEYRDRWAGYSKQRINALRTLPAKLRWLVSAR